MTDFEQKVAIITGGARGIGLAAAGILSVGGANVLIADIDTDLAADAARNLPGPALAVDADLTDPDAPDRIVEAAVDEWGRLDIVVNNAGYLMDGPIHTMADRTFEAMLDIHAVAPFRLLRAAAPHLRDPAKRERERGEEVFRKVVNVSSASGTMGNAGQVNYAAGKAALVGMTKTLAKEWGRFKVNVNAVAYGVIDTRLTASRDAANTIERDGRTVQLGVPDHLRDAVAATIPLGRPGTAVEAAGAIAFLCSPWSDYVSGQVLTVNGGQMAGMTS